MTIPDLSRIHLYQRAPELGPKLLFFSGGTALNDISRHLKRYTHNSVHLVTPFDSGGSSAKLRASFDMPSIGDLRSRMIALADESILGHPDIYRLFSYRLPKDAAPDVLRAKLDGFVTGKHAMMASIKNPMRRLICNNLGFFREAMPADFDLRGASIGNLILVGGYLNNHKKLDPILFMFSKLVGVQGTVRTTVNDDLHLAVELEDGTQVVGQHLITGKEAAPLASPIKKMFLVRLKNPQKEVCVEIAKKKRDLIRNADLICYAPGSFYSSVMANLHPLGVAEAVVQNPVPKVYLPSLGVDPEAPDLTVQDKVALLLETLRAKCGAKTPASDLLNFVVLDTKHADYAAGAAKRAIRSLGVEVIDTPLVKADLPKAYDPQYACAALLSLT